MIAAAVISISVVTVLLVRRVRRTTAAVSAPAGGPPERVGMHGALVARRH